VWDGNKEGGEGSGIMDKGEVVKVDWAVMPWQKHFEGGLGSGKLGVTLPHRQPAKRAFNLAVWSTTQLESICFSVRDNVRVVVPTATVSKTTTSDVVRQAQWCLVITLWHGVIA